MTGTTTAERLAWALDKLDECGKATEFTIGMCRSIADCREHLAALSPSRSPVGGEASETQPLVTPSTTALVEGSASLQGEVAGLARQHAIALEQNAAWADGIPAIESTMREAAAFLSALAAPPNLSKADVGALVGAAKTAFEAWRETPLVDGELECEAWTAMHDAMDALKAALASFPGAAQ